MSRTLIQVLSHLARETSTHHLRLYGRWSHRSPAKVLLPYETNSKVNLKKEKIISLDTSVVTKKQVQEKESKPEAPKTHHDKTLTPETPTKHHVETLVPEKVEKLKSKREDKLKKRKFYLSQQKVFDENGEIIYEKLNVNDSRITSFLVKLKSKKERLLSRQILVESWRLIVDGLQAKCSLKYVIFSRTADLINLRPFLPKTGVKIYKIPYKEIQMWSDLETSPGIFGIFETPTPENVRSLSRPLPLQFVCDNIRVPGNLGAILRVAVGAGCEMVILSKGCVDLWDPKVIRSAAGAHFRLPIYHSIDWTEMSNHLEENTSVFIADSNTVLPDDASEKEYKLDTCNIPVLPYYSVEFPTINHVTLIIGGETEGVSNDSYQLAASKNGLRLNIPLQRGVDSLNTGMATAVIAFEIRKQLIKAWTKDKHERKMSHAV